MLFDRHVHVKTVHKKLEFFTPHLTESLGGAETSRRTEKVRDLTLIQ